MRPAIAAAALLAVGLAHAQVYRCPGPNGRTTYTDSPCAGGTDLGTMDRNAVQARRPAPVGAPSPLEDPAPRLVAPPSPSSPSELPPVPAQRAPRTRLAPPVALTNCDPGGCWDGDGTRYTRAAGGNFFRQDGAFCQPAGDRLRCVERH